MKLIPIQTSVIHAGDDIAALLRRHADMHEGDVIVISSKAIATAEGAAVDLSLITPTPDADVWAAKCNRTPQFMEAVIRETERLNGRIVGEAPGAVLTDVKPAGLNRGSLLVPNAGMDQSNVIDGWAVGWPRDPVASAKRLHDEVQCAIIIGDSCCRPRRLGVTAFALTACGVDPFKSEVGSHDLFGHALRVTVEATADQLTTAANILMGNAAQSTPAVIIRDHGMPMSDFCGWVDGIDAEEDLFKAMF